MIGVTVKWFQLDGRWVCELKKQLGPHILSVQKAISMEKPTSQMCLLHEDTGLKELKQMEYDIRMGRGSR